MMMKIVISPSFDEDFMVDFLHHQCFQDNDKNSDNGNYDNCDSKATSLRFTAYPNPTPFYKMF